MLSVTCCMTTLVSIPSKHIRVKHGLLVTDERRLRTVNARGDPVVDGVYSVLNAGNSLVNTGHPVIHADNSIINTGHSLVDTDHSLVNVGHPVVLAAKPIM